MDEESLIKDIADGLTDSELMERHKLSAADLRRRILQFIRDNVVNSAHVFWRPILYDYEVGNDDRRTAPRHPLKLLLPVSVVGSSKAASGLLIEINEKGGCLRGMNPPLGERMNLSIDSGGLISADHIILEAVFRWSEPVGGDEFLAGFEIVGLSGRDSNLLRDLIHKTVRT